MDKQLWSDMVDSDEEVDVLVLAKKPVDTKPRKQEKKIPICACGSTRDIGYFESSYGKFVPMCQDCLPIAQETIENVEAFPAKCEACGTRNNLFMVKVEESFFKLRCRECSIIYSGVPDLPKRESRKQLEDEGWSTVKTPNRKKK